MWQKSEDSYMVLISLKWLKAFIPLLSLHSRQGRRVSEILRPDYSRWAVIMMANRILLEVFTLTRQRLRVASLQLPNSSLNGLQAGRESARRRLFNLDGIRRWSLRAMLNRRGKSNLAPLWATNTTFFCSWIAEHHLHIWTSYHHLCYTCASCLELPEEITKDFRCVFICIKILTTTQQAAIFNLHPMHHCCPPVDRHCWHNEPDQDIIICRSIIAGLFKFVKLIFWVVLLFWQCAAHLLKLGWPQLPSGRAAIWMIWALLVPRPVLSRSNITNRFSSSSTTLSSFSSTTSIPFSLPFSCLLPGSSPKSSPKSLVNCCSF